MRKGMLYYLYPSIRRWIYKIVVIGGSIRLLYPRIGIGLGSSLRGAFKKSASFIAHCISIKVKAFALELAKAEVKTWYLLRNKVQGIVQLLLPTSQPRLTYNMLIPFNPREESCSRVPLFLTLYHPPKLTGPYLSLPLLGSFLQSNLFGCIRSRLLNYWGPINRGCCI